jgi:SAM-dependent methyltransferase
MQRGSERGVSDRPRGFAAIFSKEIVTAGLDYFEYQFRVAREVVLPWLERRIDLTGRRVGDFGCHEGGMLEALRTSTVASATGFELNEAVVAASPFEPDERFRIEIADLTVMQDPPRFDLVLLHDVLEHVHEPVRVLEAVRAALAPGGRAYVSFPPYWSAFGGHQHLAAGFARAVPYVHYLPARLFFRMAAPGDNEYMAHDDSMDDLVSVRRTRLSIAKAERAVAHAGLAVVSREFFLLRPEYTVRYGFPTVAAGALGSIPLVREVAVNGAFYLLAPVGEVERAGETLPDDV